MNTIQTEYPQDFSDYVLLDSGNAEKLEVFGGYTIIRPDPRAMWQPHLGMDVWKKADAHFIRTGPDSGNWKIRKPAPALWHFHYRDMTLSMRPTDFKHVGVFPEQTVNWDWLGNKIHGKAISVLNLFAYTGGASIAAARSGAFVTHVDSAKSTINWAHENAKLNHIGGNTIRWIEDDAYRFVQREVKRGKTYDAIIMDPPRFGRGSKGEVWKIQEDLPKLLSACKQILTPSPLFVLINAYTADISSIVLYNVLKDMMDGRGGTVTCGELMTKEKDTSRLLPQGIVGRWER